MLLKIHRLEFQNSWPHERIVQVRTVEASDRVVAEADFDESRMWILPDGEAQVRWGLVEDQFGDPNARDRDPKEVWVQFEYAAFSSRKAADDARIEPLRSKLRKDGLGAIPFPEELRPEELHFGSVEDGFHEQRVNARIRLEPLHALLISEPSGLPIINEQTIPDDEEAFGWVDVQVMTYGPLESLPTYRELLERLAAYRTCFEGLIE